ncbi:uncharacterized protein MELLADRAFT_90030 [Melampsora larici-populina 98AG31]|uniref:Uncharacterized protein n=1 Tax=Melampsora larici-populina (strain 98AG31 / pathotype 3-4-7) TaxID=747676 RepID=F4RVH1_MELLP|nr:uncharacterized protein MELLADRAFT_90030 [Melampsora larici-populina 98AG31]EGG03623.1 hypothetical protein MELLADRAFT_90030 [Melampsora larici-populina 98AG31]
MILIVFDSGIVPLQIRATTTTTSNSNLNQPHAAYKQTTLLSKSLIVCKEERSIKPDLYPQLKGNQVISGYSGWFRSATAKPGNKRFATDSGDQISKI